jgi:hypothetical protein
MRMLGLRPFIEVPKGNKAIQDKTAAYCTFSKLPQEKIQEDKKCASTIRLFQSHSQMVMYLLG